MGKAGNAAWEGVKATTPVGAYYDAKEAIAAGKKGNRKEAAWYGAMAILGVVPAVGPEARLGSKVGGNAFESVIDFVKSVPNPFGKLGGPLHQEKVAEVAKAMADRGLRVRTEVRFDTPTGIKNSRFADVVGYKDGQIAEIAQIGRVNQNGTPVAREVRAANDIAGSPTALGFNIDFYGYNAFGGPR